MVRDHYKFIFNWLYCLFCIWWPVNNIIFGDIKCGIKVFLSYLQTISFPSENKHIKCLFLFLGAYSKYSRHCGCSSRGWSPSACDWHNGIVCSWWWMCFRTSCHGARSWKFTFWLPIWSSIEGTHILRLETLFLCTGL